MDVTKIIAVIKTVSALVPGGAEATKAAKAVYDLAVSVAPTLAEDDQRKLQQALPDLLERMNTDVDAALAALRAN